MTRYQHYSPKTGSVMMNKKELIDLYHRKQIKVAKKPPSSVNKKIKMLK